MVPLGWFPLKSISLRTLLPPAGLLQEMIDLQQHLTTRHRLPCSQLLAVLLGHFLDD